ncbi:MAG: RNA polymerase sigma factor [Acidobacteria bacterium]|nr:RNA polymerase sigma factor [Acidobacteriota bacterium]
MSGDEDDAGRRESGASRPNEAESTLHLIERARSGDQDAVDRLFARHVRPLQRWASGRLPKWARDVADTDDLVQETLLQTFKRIGEFEVRGVGALNAYLRQAILNRIREELRRKGRRPESTDLTGEEVETSLSPLEQAIGTETVERYERALSRLRVEERDVIIPEQRSTRHATRLCPRDALRFSRGTVGRGPKTRPACPQPTDQIRADTARRLREHLVVSRYRPTSDRLGRRPCRRERTRRSTLNE